MLNFGSSSILSIKYNNKTRSHPFKKKVIPIDNFFSFNKCIEFILFMSYLKQLAKFPPNLRTDFLLAKLFFPYKYQLTKKLFKSSHQANSLLSVSPN